jgi:hypothetical protein
LSVEKESNEESILFRAFEKKEFGPSRCFLCGSNLNNANRSDEHVIPRWVQDRFNLWDKTMTLQNGTLIPYRQLKIPCCKKCNNDFLSPIERSVAEASKTNAKSVRSLGNKTLFLWLGKIFYGILYRESLLSTDRSNLKGELIVPNELLAEYKMHHFFLQSARIPMVFENSFPASIFVFDLQKPNKIESQFDFNDEIQTLTISVRIGKIGILGALQDGGAQANGFCDFFKKLYKFKLHPIQFKELTAMFVYKALLFNRMPKYLISDLPDGIKIFQLPLGGFSRKPLYDYWDQAVYAKILAQLTGFSLEKIYSPPKRVMSWLYGSDGNLQHLELDDKKSNIT